MRVSTLACKHTGHQAREDVNTQALQAREHASPQGRKVPKHVIMQAH